MDFQTGTITIQIITIMSIITIMIVNSMNIFNKLLKFYR